MVRTLYLDNASTTPVFKQVVKTMEKYYLRQFGNPSSPHALGEQAAEVLRSARTTLARTINARPWEIIFTSGGTEANNLAIRGIVMHTKNKKRNKMIISSIEHSSVWEVAANLENEGIEVVRAPVNHEGFVDIERLARLIDSRTSLVSIMHANNEIGTIQNISRIGELCRQYGAYFHTDAVQSYGKISIDVKKMNIDLLTASAHKIGGPKGTGFLYAREGISIEPMIIGGEQERNLRAGTENIPCIVGFAEAYKINAALPREKILSSRDKIIMGLERLGGVLNGSREHRIHTNVNISFPGNDSELLVEKLSRLGIYCSTRSACLSKIQTENRVLSSMGLPSSRSESSIRISLVQPLTSEEISFMIKAFQRALGKNI